MVKKQRKCVKRELMLKRQWTSLTGFVAKKMTIKFWLPSKMPVRVLSWGITVNVGPLGVCSTKTAPTNQN